MPVCEIPPVEPLRLTVRLPPMVEGPRTRGRVVLRATLPVPEFVRATVPVKAFPGSVRLMVELPVVKVEFPLTVRPPDASAILPPAVTVRLPSTIPVGRVNAALLTFSVRFPTGLERVRLFVALLFRKVMSLPSLARVTAPVKALALPRVITPVALKLEVPPTVRVPDSVMGPPAVIARFPVRDEVPTRVRAVSSVTVTVWPEVADVSVSFWTPEESPTVKPV